MICGTPHSPGKAFVEFVRDFVRFIANGDYGAATAGLDAGDGGRWSKERIVRDLDRTVSGRVSSPDGLTRSAEPTLTEVVPRDVFVVRHRLPVDGRWSEAAVTFRFERRKGDYFRVVLVGFEGEPDPPKTPRGQRKR